MILICFDFMLQMASVAEDLEEQMVDDVEAVGGLDEVVKILQPYLLDSQKVTDFTASLKVLGIKNLSHLDLLEHADIADYMSVISFRQMRKDRDAMKENQRPGNLKVHYFFFFF